MQEDLTGTSLEQWTFLCELIVQFWDTRQNVSTFFGLSKSKNTWNCWGLKWCCRNRPISLYGQGKENYWGLWTTKGCDTNVGLNGSRGSILPPCTKMVHSEINVWQRRLWPLVCRQAFSSKKSQKSKLVFEYFLCISTRSLTMQWTRCRYQVPKCLNGDNRFIQVQYTKPLDAIAWQTLLCVTAWSELLSRLCDRI